jgi:predicted dehydrogenase
VHLNATNWFRTQRYFDEGAWRTTWRVAGGGVLMIQAVHQVDALIATVGMPARVSASVRTRAHRAEVEDEAIVKLEWENGARGTIVASLNEPAGYERFEVVGALGAATLENGYDLRVARFDDVGTQIEKSTEAEGGARPEWAPVEVTPDKNEFQLFRRAHAEFADAIASGRPSIVDGESGTRAVELANAAYLSAVNDAEVTLPLAPVSYPSVFEELASGRRVLPL